MEMGIDVDEKEGEAQTRVLMNCAIWRQGWEEDPAETGKGQPEGGERGRGCFQSRRSSP